MLCSDNWLQSLMTFAVDSLPTAGRQICLPAAFQSLDGAVTNKPNTNPKTNSNSNTNPNPNFNTDPNPNLIP